MDSSLLSNSPSSSLSSHKEEEDPTPPPTDDDVINLSFPFRGRQVPVTVSAVVSKEHATMAVSSDIFIDWYRSCEENNNTNNKKRQIEIHSVEIQSVDVFGAR